MRKLFLVGAVALFGAMNAQTGNFKLGAHIGLPVGDASDAGLDFNAGIDVAYTWRVAPQFDLGITTGYSHYFGEKQTITIPFAGNYTINPSFGIIPLAATGQYSVNEQFFIGADLGYAFYTGDNVDGGGFLYQPKIGYTFMSRNDLYLSYKGISDDGSSLGSINLGYAYKF